MSKIIKLGMDYETFERLYTKPHDEWLAELIERKFKFDGKKFTSKRTNKWNIKLVGKHWRVTNEYGLPVIKYPSYVGDTLHFVISLSDLNRLDLLEVVS